MLDILADYGLVGLFIGSFLAATVVPFSADVLLVGMRSEEHTSELQSP